MSDVEANSLNVVSGTLRGLFLNFTIAQTVLYLYSIVLDLDLHKFLLRSGLISYDQVSKRSSIGKYDYK